MSGTARPRITVEQARRLALESQGLGPQASGSPRPPVPLGGVGQLVQQLGYLQRDPLSVVCQSPHLVLWSRLGSYSPAVLERALWQERSLFEYWAHAAAIVPTADFRLHRWRMRHHGLGQTPQARRQADWMAANGRLRREILVRLGREGPLSGSAFAGRPNHAGEGSGWSAGRDHQRMLECLWLQGRVMVAGRGSRGRIWTRAEEWLPEALAEPVLAGPRALVELSERSLAALGVATANQVGFSFSGGAPGRVEPSLELLVRQRRAQEVTVTGSAGPLPGRWFASPAALARWEAPGLGAWSGRTTLLSPFDNLIIDRARTELLFDFRYRMEIYVPLPQRQHGYYVLPILHGDRLVGRVDCRRDRLRQRLVAAAVHVEPSISDSEDIPHATRLALDELAAFVGVAGVAVEGPVGGPPSWRRVLRA